MFFKPTIKRLMPTLTLHASRVSALFQTCKDIPWDGLSTLFVVFGTSENMLENQRSAALIQHLFESPTVVEELALLFQPCGTILVITNKNPATIDVSGVPTARVITTASFDSELAALLGDAGVLGVAKRELKIQTGSFAVELVGRVESIGDARLRDTAPLLGALIYVKDEAALDSLTKAASLCTATMKRFVRPYLEECLSSGRPPTLAAFEGSIRHKLEHPNEIEGMADFSLEHFAPSLAQRVMHVGRFASSLQDAEQFGDLLEPNVITVRFGARHRGEQCFVARTFLIEKNAPKESLDAYSFLAEVHQFVVDNLRVGSLLSEVAATAMRFAVEKNADLAKHLVKSFGYVTGLLVMEARAQITEKANAVRVQENMAFAVRTVLDNVPSVSTGKSFGMEIGDTVTIRDGQAEFKTKLARALDDVKYADAAEEDEENVQRDLRSITRQGKSTVPLFSREEERDIKRQKLLAQLHSEFLSSGGKNCVLEDLDVVRTQTLGQIATGDLTSYGPSAGLPDLGPTKLAVHREKRVAWVPICGVPTPFHVSTIQRVDLKQEGDQAVLSIFFFSLQESNVAFRLNRTKVFVKDVTFSAPREEVFHDFVRNVNEAMRDIKARDQEMKNRQGVAKGGVVTRIPNPKMLKNIKMRPAPAAGKQGFRGNLEVHENGLRFVAIAAAPIDMLYANVKHFIFEPSKNSLATIFHVTLKQPMLIGKKKSDELSFYADVLEASESVESTRKTYEQEIDQEERDKERIDETNREFAVFGRDVHHISGKRVEIPSSFEMTGVTHRSPSTIHGSPRLIWTLTELPPFTLSVSDIEFASIERVTDGGDSFDVNFIPKNYKAAIPITIIPRSFLEGFKDWCLSAGLYYTENSVNIQWTAIFKSVRDDPTWQPFGPGGWAALGGDDEDEEDEEGSDDDEDSDPSYDSEEDEEEEDEEDDSEFDSESSASTAESDSDSDASWDALEAKASKHDREQDYDDDDSDRPRKKAPRTSAVKSTRAAPSKLLPVKSLGKIPPAPAAGGRFAAPRQNSSAPPQMPRRF